METPVFDKSASPCSTLEDPRTPAPSRTNSGKRPMSATLRERLRKTRRSFNSSSIVAKRLKVDAEGKECASEEAAQSIKEPCSTLQDSSQSLEANCTKSSPLQSPLQEGHSCGCVQNLPRAVSLGPGLNQQDLLEEKRRLVKQLQEKEELLRRLRLVKMYRSKNNLSELQCLIAKWRSSTQLMLYELQSAFSTDGKKVSLTQLIDSLGLEDQLLHYSRTEEDFINT
ncbi:PREDICTED: swi5-dependent recombination DNA repair protein 1 homolog [Gavialis gangeticus]|uniref:swi5-dependent recombination DNA repair protein 1 homolog n=1 Tax=Gavialis gangeticus TaxID=94835 RepID=UPI00092EFA7E|nr:PREDICTED: swi5-dependent recombination DNA repair protein 1 homolog [Gavialis gangeticus]